MIIKKKKTEQEIKELKTEEALEQIKTEVLPKELDLDNISFNTRDERRRGDRRRGYRRIDERKLVSRAQEEAITIRENASKEGFQKGLEMATDEIEKIKNSLVDVAGVKESVYKEISNDILDIALAVAQKIINKEVTQDKSIIIGMIVNALNDCGKNESKITLKMSAEDADIVKEFLPTIVDHAQTEAKINIVAINDIQENNVIIETNNGIMDISFQTQLKVLKELFKTI